MNVVDENYYVLKKMKKIYLLEYYYDDDLMNIENGNKVIYLAGFSVTER